MTGGLIQLVAYGVQDVVLSGSPQITFFKMVYKRHTNFAMEEFEQSFSGPMDFCTRNDVTIARRGDMMTHMTLEFDLTPNNLSMTCDFDTMTRELANITYLTQKHQRAVAAGSITNPTISSDEAEYLLHIPIDTHINPRFTHYAAKTGHILIKSVELEIGGQQIDKQYGEWLELWSQLTESAQQQNKLSQMVSIDNSQDGRIYVPLRFWFCMNPGLALPLVSLQYHDVIMYLNLNNKQSLESDYFNYISALEAISQLPTGGGDTDGDDIVTQLAAKFSSGALPTSEQLSNRMGMERVALFVNYIYLDTDERRRFAQQAHEYLITQLQQNTSNTVPAGGTRINIELNLNHPVKEMMWVVQNIGNRGDAQFNYWNGNLPGPTENPYLSSNLNADSRLGDQVKDALLLLNGTERFQKRRGAYFRLVQPYYHNTGAGNFLPQSICMGKPGMATYMAQALTQTLSGVTDDDDTNQGTYSTNRLFSAGKNAQGGFYSYSFAIDPEEAQPSGSCNFSRLDTSTLILDLYPSNNGSGESISRSVNIYALNYNILRVTNGMGGLAYAN